MVAYIIQLCQEIVSAAQSRNAELLFTLIRVLPEEVNRLDPRDFLPSARLEFVKARLNARHKGSISGISSASDYDQIGRMARHVIQTLEQFGGEGSQSITRSFAFIVDAELRTIIERDYRELRLTVFPSRAWKSTVILSGSLLEAILFDKLTGNPATLANAQSSSKTPKNRSGAVRDIHAGDWKLVDLIEVSADIRLIPKERAKSMDQVLRDYRNFVHPKKEIRAQHPCTEAEAMMSIGALEGVCNIFQ